jgi:hypothetical protein
MDEEILEHLEREKSKRLVTERAIYSELSEREAEISKYREMLREREQELEQREKVIYSRQKDMENQFAKGFEETEHLRHSLKNELLKKEAELKNLLVETEREKERYREDSRKSIESKSQKFVDSALQLLNKKETKFHDISKNWSIIGATAIVLGIGFAVYTMISSADLFHQSTNTSISYYLYSLFRGLIVVSLFGALSRYSFILSNSFMHESLKSGERLHAIKFGEFYLDAYGADAEWEQLKEAFENWNISGSSAFTTKDVENANSNLAESIITGFEKATKIRTESSNK